MKEFFKKTVVLIITALAKLTLKRYHPKIIGVTGSVGKTSTKDAIYVALAPFFHIRKSEKSFNSDTGVPLSILGCPNAWMSPWGWIKNFGTSIFLIMVRHNYPKWLVLEIGADRPDDIKNLAKWVKPDVAVITCFPNLPSHIEFFESREHIIEEKTSLAKALSKDGLLILNSDDEAVLSLGAKITARVATYGRSINAMMRGVNFKREYEEQNGIIIPRGISFEAHFDQQIMVVSMPNILSESHMYSALAGLAIAWKEGCDVAVAVTALAKYCPPPGRASLVLGMNDSFIIDDTYNSSPLACESALNILADMKTNAKKIAVIGDMLELGKHTEEAHKEIGKLSVKSCDILVTVGLRAKVVSDTALVNGMAQKKIIHFNDAISVGEYLKSIIMKGDIILVKGSQGMRLERAVSMIIRDPADAPKLLVRQEKEWLERK